MKKIITFSFCLVALMAFSFSSVAQNISVNNNAPTESYGQLPLTDGTVTITHSVDPVTITAGNSVTCSAGGITSDNQLWRSFVLSDFSLPLGLDVTSVEFGIEEATGPVGGMQPCTVNLYTTPTPFPPAAVTDLVLIGTTSFDIPDQALTLFSVPVTGTAGAGTELVVEISIPADIGNGNRFWLGSNEFGETAPSYLSSAGCGLVWPPLTTVAIGFPTAFWVINVTGDEIIPVELTSFAASVNENDVVLNWSTATETNNMGFEVQRSNGSDYTVLAFVDGNGTTTEAQNYTFTDGNLNVGTYTYRLKQIDFDGTSEFSNVIEVKVLAPDVYALEQNYPNPFNPSTMIKFGLAVDSKVSLTVFDVLGQEVVNLVNGNLAAGSHEFDFNASNLNSGVFFYRIDAAGIDGTNFSSVKKMLLTK
jgi:hypothetical protein